MYILYIKFNLPIWLYSATAEIHPHLTNVMSSPDYYECYTIRHLYTVYLVTLILNLNSFFEDLQLDWSPFPGSVVTPCQLSERWSVCAADIVLVEHFEMAVIHRCLCCTVRTQTTIDINNYTVPKSRMNHFLLWPTYDINTTQRCFCCYSSVVFVL